MNKNEEIGVSQPEGELTRGQIDRIIMIAWEDRTGFDVPGGNGYPTP